LFQLILVIPFSKKYLCNSSSNPEREEISETGKSISRLFGGVFFSFSFIKIGETRFIIECSIGF